IVGVAQLPAGIVSRAGAGIISRDGAGIISRDGAGYRVAALPAEVPIRKQLVYLMNAAGKLVVGANGEPMTAMTDETGRFEFKGFVNDKHLVIAIALHENKGLMTSILPRSTATSRTVGLNLASTLTATYIQEQYVKPQRDPVTVFERLPADLETATRAAVATAAARHTPAPADHTARGVAGAVDGLRSANKAVDDQFVEVKRVLLAGLSDQGVGQPADTLETDALDLAVAPSGELAFASAMTLRVWRKDANGRLAAITGTGFLPAGTAAGDGGAATAAALSPVAITYGADGALYIADNATQRIRKVAPDGVISTVASSPDWQELRDVAVEPGGGLVVATHSAVWRVPAGGQPTLIAGAPRVYDATWAFAPSTGDGGTPLAARFRGITGMALDPRNGDVFVYDAGVGVRRFNATTIERVAGNGTPGFGGDGGAATQAQLGVVGSVAVKPDGTLLIADSTNHRLREVAGGTITTVAGTGAPSFAGEGGPARSAGVFEPLAPVTGANGTVYFIGRGYVRELAGGNVRTIIGGTRGFDTPRAASEVQLLGPTGLSYDAASHVVRVEDERHVWRWTLDDNKLVSEFGGPAGSAAFVTGQSATQTGLTQPRSLVGLGAGRWAVLGSDPATLLAHVLLVENGKLTSLAGGASSVDTLESDVPAAGAAIPGTDNFLVEHGGWYYYTVASFGHIRRFQPGGNTEKWAGYGTSTTSGGLAKDFRFSAIAALAKGPDGQIYLGTDRYIYRIDPATTVVTRVAGMPGGATGDGGPATGALLNKPTGMAWDAAGHMYFSEPAAGIVRRIRKDTVIIERVSGAGTPNYAGQTIDTGLGEPLGLVFDKNGNLYIADRRHGQVKVVEKAKIAP
ncbi:MAG: hypothetical protein ACK46X_10155, partial [Candidatus Sericytochromatia bacterium]